MSEFQSDREEVFKRQNTKKSIDIPSHIEGNWGWYALAVFSILAVVRGWIFEWCSYLVWALGEAYEWYVFGLADVASRPIATLTLSDLCSVIGGVILRVWVALLVYVIGSSVVNCFKSDENEEEW